MSPPARAPALAGRGATLQRAGARSHQLRGVARVKGCPWCSRRDAALLPGAALAGDRGGCMLMSGARGQPAFTFGPRGAHRYEYYDLFRGRGRAFKRFGRVPSCHAMPPACTRGTACHCPSFRPDPLGWRDNTIRSAQTRCAARRACPGWRVAHGAQLGPMGPAWGRASSCAASPAVDHRLDASYRACLRNLPFPARGIP